MQPRERWPATKEEFDRQVAAAKAKYSPIVMKLPPTERIGLMEAVRTAIAALKEEADQEDLRRGYRPPGTTLGNR